MPDLDLSNRTLGEFVLRERIGVGGHGTVYRCEQRALGRDVVVKVLRPRKTNDAQSERFVREAKLASRLDHPYSAHVYAFGVEDDGVRWIATELVQGVSLGDWLKARGPMPLAQFVPFFELIAEVVHAAHRRGIVHRDLKPSNVMVIESGARWLPKLLDFGIARIFDDPSGSDDELSEDGHVGAAVPTARLRPEPPPYRTRTGPDEEAIRLTPLGAVLGSTPYMSPEQWGEPWSVGPASDIYALGCLAHEALTGRTPFTAGHAPGYRDLHLGAEPPSLGDAFPPGVDAAIRRALAKSPDARQQSALELAAAFRAALRAEPHEQLRAAALQWEDRARSPDLLWGRQILTDVERSVPPKTMSELECSFVAASHRRARRRAWVLRILVGAVACGAIAAFAVRAEMKADLAEADARSARQLADAKTEESELEQGRAALLHGEPEAQRHLAEAYRRDPSPATAFMLARAMQPRLSEKAHFESTRGRMWWATFSPDGSQIATSDDLAAQVWDGKMYRLLYTLPHGCEVYQAIYSRDGTRLVTVAKTMVRIWNARNGTLLHDLKPRRGQAPSDFFRAAVSPDGRFIAAMDASGSLASVWDMEHGERIAELRNHGANVPRLAFSADGWLATTGGEEAHIFDVRHWTQVQVIHGPIQSLAFDARSRLVTGSSTGEVTLWSIPSGARLRQLRASGEPVHAVAFSRDGALVAAGSDDGTMQVWRTDDGSLRSQLNPRHGKVIGIEFDPSAASLLAANADGTAMVTDAAQGLPLAIMDGPSSALRTASFSPDGTRVVGASWDGTARVWQAASPYRRWAAEPVGDDCDIGIGSRPDRRFIAVGCRGLPTRVWDTAHDRLLAELPSATPIDAKDFISAAPAVSAAGDLAAVARGTAVNVYGLPGGRLLRTLEHGAAVSAIAFTDSDAGHAMASGALDGSVRVVREDGSTLALQASGGVEALALLPDGRILVADAERRLGVYAADGTLLATLELPVRVMSLRREDTRLVALANCLANAAPPLLIDLERRRVVARLEGHVGWVLSARWVSGARVLTAGADGTARLWDGSTGQLLQTYKGGSRTLADAALMSGAVVGGGADGLLRFWDAASGARLWTLPAHKSAVTGVHLEGDDIVTRALTGEVSRWRLPRSEAVIAACARSLPCAIVP
ncbi:MAG TPA: protein kinase [Kofleriaceae bacterium]|jgi:WD40 repeat protein/serine/threonine protein kinase|nr:protein kinase [Kofleriaceae bacterium]